MQRAGTLQHVGSCRLNRGYCERLHVSFAALCPRCHSNLASQRDLHGSQHRLRQTLPTTAANPQADVRPTDLALSEGPHRPGLETLRAGWNHQTDCAEDHQKFAMTSQPLPRAKKSCLSKASTSEQRLEHFQDCDASGKTIAQACIGGHAWTRSNDADPPSADDARQAHARHTGLTECTCGGSFAACG